MTAVSYVKDAMQRKGVSLYRLSKLTGLKYELLRRTLLGKRKFPADEFITIMVELNRLPTPRLDAQSVGKPLTTTFADAADIFRDFCPFEIAMRAAKIIPCEPYARKLSEPYVRKLVLKALSKGK